MIRVAKTTDAHELSNIYNYYIINTVATFEEDAINEHEMINRMNETFSLGLPWLVTEDDDGKLIGYAYASKWKNRSAYRFSTEVTVYLAQTVFSKGVGSRLYEALFDELRKMSIHTVIGGISLPNPASIALHEKFDMKKVAHFKDVGFKFGKWVDVGYWQGVINRHSLPHDS